jgi:hypothetical protein
MNATRLIDGMERFGAALPAVVAGLDAAACRWRPAAGGWSVLEIVRHLGDEEVEDFRARLRRTLEDPGRAWDPIDPERAAVERRYNDGDFGEAIDRFVTERRDSVAWLRGLGRADWATTHHHPRFGGMRAGDLLVSWAAHDALHLRQIAKRLHQMALDQGAGFDAAYAGAWTA